MYPENTARYPVCAHPIIVDFHRGRQYYALALPARAQESELGPRLSSRVGRADFVCKYIFLAIVSRALSRTTHRSNDYSEFELDISKQPRLKLTRASTSGVHARIVIKRGKVRDTFSGFVLRI